MYFNFKYIIKKLKQINGYIDKVFFKTLISLTNCQTDKCARYKLTQ